MAALVGASMGLRRSLLWGVAFLAAGAIVAGGWMPGSAEWSQGPRIGIATLLLVWGFLIMGFALSPWILRKTTRKEDYEGACPVGATCACGHFNFKPRKDCRQCGAATGF
jgi:hypothetical protein